MCERVCRSRKQLPYRTTATAIITVRHISHSEQRKREIVQRSQCTSRGIGGHRDFGERVESFVQQNAQYRVKREKELAEEKKCASTSSESVFNSRIHAKCRHHSGFVCHFKFAGGNLFKFRKCCVRLWRLILVCVCVLIHER